METFEPEVVPDALERAGLDEPGPDLGVQDDVFEGELPDGDAFPADDAATDEVGEPIAVAPPVVAVVVTSGTGEFLDATLSALAAQDYPALSVLVIDNGSTEDPTPRIAAAMPRAFVRRRPGDTGFGAAANDALASVEGATFLLFCHDDVTPDPDAVRVLVEEAYRSNAGIVGPKLVDQDRPEILLEVGMAVDHYGVAFSAIEPDEVDQEQHDAVRDVFFVSHAAMLVRLDLFHELGGFDPQTFPGSDDIDLCWRARLAGARIVVAPAARVRHRGATRRVPRSQRDPRGRELRAETRGRVRVLCKSYSGLALCRVLPIAFGLVVAESVGLVASGRPRRGRALLAGWFAAFRSPRELHRARASTQELRRIDDGDVRDLMIGGSARVRAFVTRRMHAGERLAEVGTRTRVRMNEATDRLRRAPAVIAAVFALLLAFGCRSLLLNRVPEIGSFRAWPGVGSLWQTFVSPWRATMMGAPRPATPAFALMAVIGTVLFGHVGLARSLVVGLSVPAGAWGAYRVVRPWSNASAAAIAAAIVYGGNPVARNAVERGELGPLVCFALAPFVLLSLMRAGAADTTRGRVHAWLTTVLLVAIVGSLWPPGALLALFVAGAFVASWPLAGGGRAAMRGAATAATATLAATVLLSPWSASLLGADAATLGLQPRGPLRLADLLRFRTAGAGAGWASWGILAAAVVPLLVASGARLAWAKRGWILAAASFALAWLPARLAPRAAIPSPEGVLVPAALGLAIAAGLGIAAILDDLPRRHFGWRQAVVALALAGVGATMIGFAPDTVSGRLGAGDSDWASAYSWMRDGPVAGGFRVLWIGDPAVLPADAKHAGVVGFALTRNGPGDARASFAAPEQRADRVIAGALTAATAGSTARLGHLLAPAGVRYIAFVARAAPGNATPGRPDPVLVDALQRQLDLSLSRIDPAGVVYENDAWIPMHAVVPAGDASIAVDGRDPSASALRSEPGTVIGAAGTTGASGRIAAVGPGTLLWSESASTSWRATANGSSLPRRDAFGWTNAFTFDHNAAVAVHYPSSTTTIFWRDLEIALWLGAFVAWAMTRRRGRREPAVAEVAA